MHYDRITRWLHLLLAILIVAQLATGQFMDDGEHESEHVSLVATALAHGTADPAAQDEEGLVAELHEAGGLAALVVLLLRLIWAFAGPAEAGWRRWFPWMTSEGRAELLADARRELPMWLTGRLPEPSESDTIAKSVHGIMILAALAAALAGFGLWLLGSHEHGLGHDVAELHEGFANAVLVLVLGHVAMTLWHRLLGHDMAARILPWKAR